MINPKTDEDYMQLALKEAMKAADADEVPVGAVIVHEDRVIARAHNQKELLCDPTAHAEMIAITQAAAALESRYLTDCTLYCTLEPCSMCAGAMVLARIKRLVFGAFDPKAGAAGSVLTVVGEKRLNHRPEVLGGVLEGDCSELLKYFFLQKRKGSLKEGCNDETSQ